MKNIVTKNLIILGAIVFSFALTTGASAYYNPYDSANWLVSPTVSTYDYNPADAYASQYYGYYNPVLAANPYNNPSVSQNGYYQQQTAFTTTPTPVAAQPKTYVTNNYYQTAPATVRTVVPAPVVTYVTPTNTYGTPVNTNTVPVGYNPTYNTNSAIPAGYNNTGYSNTGSNSALGASAYNSGFTNGYQSVGTGITALSLKGSGGFMPSSIWQWIFVIILILVIIIVARTLTRKPVVIAENHGPYASH